MKKIYKWLGCLVLLQVLLSCGGEDSVLYDAFNGSPQVILRLDKTTYDNLDANRKQNNTSGDAIQINSIAKENDNLVLEVTYSGGCETHNFEVVWDGIVHLEDPCFMNLIVIHDGNNDPCEALITQSISIDLSKLIGEISAKDACGYNLFTTFNASDTPDVSTFENDLIGKWVLNEMVGSIPNSATTGDDMEWQENYLFQSDGTFLKSRARDGETTEISGTFSIVISNSETFLKLGYPGENDIIGSC